MKSIAPGTRWQLGLLAAFAVVVAVNFYMVRVAVQSNVGYIEKQSWEKGQSFQKVIDAKDRFHRSGIVAELLVDTAATARSLTVVLRNSDGSAVPAGVLSVLAQRGDSATQDATLSFTEGAPGQYLVALPSTMPNGLWLLEFSLQLNGGELRFSRRLIF